MLIIALYCTDNGLTLGLLKMFLISIYLRINKNKHNNYEKFWLVNDEGTVNNKVIPNFSRMMIHLKH